VSAGSCPHQSVPPVLPRDCGGGGDDAADRGRALPAGGGALRAGRLRRPVQDGARPVHLPPHLLPHLPHTGQHGHARTTALLLPPARTSQSQRQQGTAMCRNIFLTQNNN
jgi:hypothetical protein